MANLSLDSYAKVNLTLDVLEKRPEDGYHYIHSVMVPVSLRDSVRMEHASELSVKCHPDVGVPMSRNLAYRAACLLQQETGYSSGAHIVIEKNIPAAAGLGGGSSNAASVLNGLNRLWELQLGESDLQSLAIRLGSDVPFFVTSKPAVVTGIGERISLISVRCPLWMVMVTPPVVKSTGNVYGLFDELQQVVRPDTEAMVSALAAGDLDIIAQALGNVFEQVMLPRHPSIDELKRTMVGAGAAAALMSGAGPTVFGLTRGEAEGRVLVERLRRLGHQALLVQSRA